MQLHGVIFSVAVSPVEAGSAEPRSIRVRRQGCRDILWRFKLGIAEWRLMAALGRFGPLSANEVADRTAMDKVRVSRAVAQMIEAGLLRRTIDRGDKRRSVLELSAAGWAIRSEIVPSALAIERRLTAVLDEADRATLDRLLAKLEHSASTAFVDGDPLP
ncbi:MAG TPA: MarR family winged helix-turn-helix transcriptional regulator [Stellaceae bacterium]|nr:MarR family winged helix-turn-helix transcriptional regulator [Stellaceae bacterium]